jgi:[glutamine synthetase] adenylyltransferase / [glutamine synthetase]-adenylyl-L-tyrosine phosphorylase
VGTTATELTTLAEALLEAGLRAVLTDLALAEGGARPADLPFRMAVVGMGKLGGAELHYVSDLDVVFVHEPVAGADRSRVHELANRAAERLMSALGAVTAEGSAFAMDADLRPEGKAGPLSRSLESIAAYYDRWAEPWEHQALLKARPVAGDPEIGRRFAEVVRPFAYPAEFTTADAQRMRKMKARIEKERIKRRQDPKRHLKLGPGGLLDVEWTVQYLQQRYGAAHPMLQSTNTMSALDGAQDDAVLDHRDAAWLRDGYYFLSRVRNRLYLLRHRDVDVLPVSAGDLNRLAHSLGFGPSGRQAFEEEHLRHTRHVRRVAERVFFEMPEAETRGAWERSEGT